MTTFVLTDEGTWRRGEEVHENILIATSEVPTLLAEQGVAADVREAFGTETLPVGLKAIIGTKRR